MTDQLQRHAVLSEMPRFSQQLRLNCQICGDQGSYDVGVVLWHEQAEGSSVKREYAFTHYFRCRKCGSAGPWEIADVKEVASLVNRARQDPSFQGGVTGYCALFDGTCIQTPAMGEEHLLSLIRKEPANALLCSRLGNLLRNCGETALAESWYAKAVELDPNEIESRFELFHTRVEKADFPAALAHAQRLVRCLLEGRKTENDDLNWDIAGSVAETLLGSAVHFQPLLHGDPQDASTAKEEVFIRTLLAQEGIEQEIVKDAAERLLKGQPAPDPVESKLPAAEVLATSYTDIFPTLRALIERERMNPESLTVAFESDSKGKILRRDRHSVLIYDGKKTAEWQVPTLQGLVRGNRMPPPDMDHYPESYDSHFFFIEHHVLILCGAMGDRTDQEMEEIYSMLRRRPDGRSLGLTHDLLWQVAALLLGTQVLSAAEFEALIGALERSTRRWALRPVSRNYVAFLHSTFKELAE